MSRYTLIFDDDAAFGRLVTRVAEISGLAAEAVTEPLAFEQRYKARTPSLIVLDLQLGATDGVEQLRRLAEWQFSGELVLMSGHGNRVLTTVGALAEHLGLRVVTILEKPLGVVELERLFAQLQDSTAPLSAKRVLAAIESDAMALELQPVVERSPRTLKKLEALIRWEDPCLGIIKPDDFLPVAESETAVIDALTEWVFNATVDAYQVLDELGVRVPIAVNISSRNLHDLGLPDRLGRRLLEARMPPEHLCLEMTESAAFQDVTLTMEILSRLRLKGIALSIDDFGTGYSSLKLLRQMPFSEIKIDRSFVSDMMTSRDARVIVKSIADLANNMEMDTVAEGVETEEIAATLEKMGIRALQGFLMAPPMPVEAVPSWLAVWTRADAAGVTTAGSSQGRDADEPARPAVDLSSGGQTQNGHASERVPSGGIGSGWIGSGGSGSWEAGSGEAGSGEAGSGEAGSGEPRSGEPRSGRARSGQAGYGEAGSGEARSVDGAVPGTTAWEDGSRTRPVRLSPRQLAVIRLLAEGSSVKQIAQQLGLGIGTVKVHLSLAYSALGAHNRIEAIQRAAPLLAEEAAEDA